MNRKRKTTESLAAYHRNLKAEQRKLDFRLGTQYAFARAGSIIARALRKIFRTKATVNPIIHKAKRRKLGKLSRVARRYNRAR